VTPKSFLEMTAIDLSKLANACKG